MFRPDDVVRSLRRTLFSVLGEPWTMHLAAQAVADEQRPIAVIDHDRVVPIGGRVSVPQGDLDESMAVTVTLYPALPSDGSPRTARYDADGLAAVLYDLMRIGPAGELLAGGRPASGPERFPLWDYADVALRGGAEERTPPVLAHDVFEVGDYGARAVVDPEEARRFSVVCELRATWRRGGRIVDGDPPVVVDVPGAYVLPLGYGVIRP